MAQADQLLRRPLYVFDLPAEIISTIQLKTGNDGSAAVAQKEGGGGEEGEAGKNAGSGPADAEIKSASRAKDNTGSGTPRDGEEEGAPRMASAVPSCALCASTFKDAQEQRRHAKSDFHRYNLKQRLKGLPAVSEGEFDSLVNDLAESISGSDTTESDEEGGGGEGTENGGADRRPEDTLTALLKRQARISHAAGTSGDEEPANKIKRRPGGGGSPLLWFTSSTLPPNISLGIYRAIFAHAELEDRGRITEALRQKQLPPKPGSSSNTAEVRDDSMGVPLRPASDGPHYFLCMIGGGHFAAMVVALAPKVVSKKAGGGGGSGSGGGVVEERQAIVLAHKTFHRYTTRRKQGGAQSANDASKGPAHSAGSSLRRHNEAALTNEVRQLLDAWRPMIDAAQMLFVRASGNTNRRTLFGPYDGQVLRTTDARLRSFPFNTRRATQGELMRAFVELTRVKVSEVDEAALAAAAAAEAENSAAASSSSSPRPGGKAPAAPPPPATKPSKEEAAVLLHTSQLQSLIRRSKAPAVLAYLASNALTPDFRFHPPHAPPHRHAPTPLHLAASSGAPSVVLALLTKARADPTAANADGRTPFELAADRATRNAFRVARHELGERAWAAWAAAARVPAPLSRAEAEQREERERAERDRKEEERRRAELQRLKDAEPTPQDESRKSGGGGGGGAGGLGRALGAGAELTPQEKREQEMRGMTPEMRLRLERERRARAAEERIRRMRQQT